MEVRKFEAFSMNDAIRLVKKELGKDAVILSTREKERLGVDGDKPLKIVEVVAASAASLRADADGSGRGVPTQGGQPPERSRLDATRSARDGFATLHSPGEGASSARPVEFPRMSRGNEATVVRGSPTLGALAPQTKQAFAASGVGTGAGLGARDAAASRPTAPSGARVRPPAGAERSFGGAGSGAASAGNPNAVFGQGNVPELTREQRARLDMLAGEMRGQGNGSANAAATEEVRELREELGRVRRDLESLPQVNVGEQMQEIKVLLHDIMRTRTREDETRYHEYLSDICVRLRAAGVRESIIAESLQVVAGVEAPRGEGGAPLSGPKLREFFLSQTIRVLFRQLGVTGHWRFEQARPSVVCLVGPTGVGKTTTIAKLAARLKLTDGRPVALASMDTFRIGGADQLRVYSKILDCPFIEASEPHELTEFVARQHGAQVVLVDTAGRNARHQAQMEGLQRLAGVELPIAFHLALAATMKQRDLDENLKAYKSLGIASLLFTKLDESWSYGEIINSSIGARAPLSYFTTGQKVPEDLEPATKERVVERLFRL